MSCVPWEQLPANSEVEALHKVFSEYVIIQNFLLNETSLDTFSRLFLGLFYTMRRQRNKFAGESNEQKPLGRKTDEKCLCLTLNLTSCNFYLIKRVVALKRLTYSPSLKGTVARDFGPWFFSWIDPIWAPNSYPKTFSNSGSNSRRYSNLKFVLRGIRPRGTQKKICR
jgi:hypothetical protein